MWERRFIILDRCVVYSCSKTANPDNGIDLHKILLFWRWLEDKRDGSTLCFTDEPIGNHQSIQRSPLCTLEERIFAECSPLFPGKKSPHYQGWWQAILRCAPSQQFRQTTLNSGRSTIHLLLCLKEQEWWDLKLTVILKEYEIALLVSWIIKRL